MLDLAKIRKDFPFLNQNVNKKPVVFFDTGASAQKPKSVINSVAEAYAYGYANVHRGVYFLSQQASNKYENVRNIVKEFINASRSEEIVITKGTTESINIISSSLGKLLINKDDEVVVTEMEHHANFVPWQMLCKDKKISFKVAQVKNNGDLDIDHLLYLINNKAKILAITLCSNVLGTVNPVKEIIKKVKKINPQILVVVDGAQAIIHKKVDVQDLNCDFFAFSGHKIYGPTGVGILYGKYQILEKLSPYNYGGNMIDDVTVKKTSFAKAPFKFEAGTPDIVGVIGLGEAIKYINSIGMDNITKYEAKLLAYATQKLNKLDGLNIIGQSKNKVGVITFTINNCHANDIGELLSIKAICVRTGKHCAHPLLYRFGVSSAIRMSFGIYNSFEEVDIFVKALRKVISQLQ